MELIETSVFTRQVQSALTEEEYRAFQARATLSSRELRVLRRLIEEG